MRAFSRWYWLLLVIPFLTRLGFASDPTATAWKVLEDGARDKSFLRRSDAVLALGLLPDDAKAIAMAETALTDPAPEVRKAAATALGQMHSTGSFLKLEHALDDKDISVVLAAAHALYLFQDKRAYEVYYEILLGERKSRTGLIAEQEKILRDHKKLAEMGFEEGLGFVPFGGVSWGAFKAIRQDDTSQVRAAATQVLVNDLDPRSGKALVTATGDRSWIVRAAALSAIAQRGDPSLLEHVEACLYDEKDAVRFTTAAAIIRLSADLKKTSPLPDPAPATLQPAEPDGRTRRLRSVP